MGLKLVVALFALAGVDAFAPSPLLAQRSKLAASRRLEAEEVAPTICISSLAWFSCLRKLSFAAVYTWNVLHALTAHTEVLTSHRRCPLRVQPLRQA